MNPGLATAFVRLLLSGTDKGMYTVLKYTALSHDVASGSDIMPYRFSGNVMTPISTSRT